MSCRRQIHCIQEEFPEGDENSRTRILKRGRVSIDNRNLTMISQCVDEHLCNFIS